MKIERTKNATRNIIFGVIQKIYTIIVPFVMRTAMIYFMGVEYLGLNSLFTSVLQVLNLAELGVGSAMVYSMYKPIAEDDTPTICALMRLYRTYYRIIGIVIAAAGLCATPFIPKLVKGSLPPELNIYVLYLMNLGITVLSYWLFAYKNCLLGAFQRGDVGSKISMILNTVQYVAQFCVLYFLRDYYVYLIVAMATGVCGNLVTAVVVTRMYPDYRPVGKLDNTTVKGINQRIRDLFTAKLGGTIVNSADTIVISAFIGLEMLAMYQNYYYIMSSVIGFILVIFGACTAGIGNSLVVETEEKNYKDFKKIALFTIWIATVCCACFVCVYQPFMTVWVGEKYLLDIWIVILICVYFYLYVVNQLSCVYKDAAGIWHQDRFRPLIAGIVNLVFNLAFVKIWGIYAILISTIISYIFVAMPWVIHNLFHTVFKRSPGEYVFMILKGALTSAVDASVCFFVCNLFRFSDRLSIIVNIIICIGISNAFLIIIYKNDPIFDSMLDLLDKVSKRKLHFLISKMKNKEN